MDIADRITFAPTRSRRIAIRRGVQVLARRARTARLSRCFAASAGDTSGQAMPRHLRMPWSGGYVSLARASGVERLAELGLVPAATLAHPQQDRAMKALGTVIALIDGRQARLDIAGRDFLLPTPMATAIDRADGFRAQAIEACLQLQTSVEHTRLCLHMIRELLASAPGVSAASSLARSR